MNAREADRRLPSVRKNKPVNRSNATRLNAAFSVNRKNPKVRITPSTRCANFISTPKHRRRSSASVPITPIRRTTPVVPNDRFRQTVPAVETRG